MDYALAKQLKDAGFLQRSANGASPFPWYTGNGCGFVLPATGGLDEVYVPTLFELIDAFKTKDYFRCLEADRYSGTYSGHKWLAMTWGVEPESGYAGDDVSCMEFWNNPSHEIAGGKTPEEAVARLWLALHANGDATA